MNVSTHASTPSDEARRNLRRIVANFDGQPVVVVGDLIADQFVYGEISRVSREAPVLILRHERTATIPGGAANCALNLAHLKAKVVLVGCVGTDAAGAQLLAHLRQAGIDTSGVAQISARHTVVKMRVLAGGAHSTRQQVIRVDYEESSPLDDAVCSQLNSNLERVLGEEIAACIISDYNYGVANKIVTETLRRAHCERDLPVIVDSRFRLAEFSDFTAATPNEAEVEELTGQKLTNDEDVMRVGADLRAQLNLDSLLVTRGKHGMALFTESYEPQLIAAVGAQDAVDTTGAGDTVIAAFTLALASGATTFEATQIANCAGGIVVMKRGTATLTRNELLAQL